MNILRLAASAHRGKSMHFILCFAASTVFVVVPALGKAMISGIICLITKDLFQLFLFYFDSVKFHSPGCLSHYSLNEGVSIGDIKDSLSSSFILIK